MKNFTKKPQQKEIEDEIKFIAKKYEIEYQSSDTIELTPSSSCMFLRALPAITLLLTCSNFKTKDCGKERNRCGLFIGRYVFAHTHSLNSQP
jgi:hypothetical protein